MTMIAKMATSMGVLSASHEPSRRLGARENHNCKFIDVCIRRMAKAISF